MQIFSLDFGAGELVIRNLNFFFGHISVWECDKTLNLSFAKRGRSHSRSHLMFAVLLFGRFLFSIHHSERYNFLVFFLFLKKHTFIKLKKLTLHLLPPSVHTGTILS